MTGRSDPERRQLLLVVGVVVVAVVASVVVLVVARGPSIEDVLADADVQPVAEGCLPGGVERLSALLDATLVVVAQPQREMAGIDGALLYRVEEVPFDVRPGSTAPREPGDLQRADGALPAAAYAATSDPSMLFLAHGEPRDTLLVAMVDGQPYDGDGCALITDTATSEAMSRLTEAAAELEPASTPTDDATGPARSVAAGRAAARHAATLAWRREVADAGEADDAAGPGPLQQAVEG